MFEKLLLIPGPAEREQPAVRRVLSLTERTPADIEVFDPVCEPLLEGYYGNKTLYEPLRRRLVDERLATARSIADDLQSRGRRASAAAAWEPAFDRAIARRVVAHNIDLVVTEPLEGHTGAMSHADW